MSEVLWDGEPHTKDLGFFGYVEAAASIAGQLSRPLLNVFQWSAASAGAAHRHRIMRNITIRDLQSPPQVIGDVLFMVFWGLAVGVAFLHGTSTAIEAFTRCFWNSLTVAAIALTVERACSVSPAFRATTCSGRFCRALTVWTFGIAGFVCCAIALRTSGELTRIYLAALYGTGLVSFGFWRALAAPAILRISQKYCAVASGFVVIGDANHPGLRQFIEELGGSEGGVSLVPLNLMCSEAEWPKVQRQVYTDVCRVLHGAKGGAVYLCSAGLSLPRLEALCHTLSILPVGTYIPPDPVAVELARCPAFAVGNHVTFELRRPPISRTQLAAKRATDIVLGAAALLLFAPVMIAAAVALRLDSDGPVFFRQTRTGKGGGAFRIFKFRTMHVTEDGSTIRQACRNDLRVIRVGRFLRSSSIDELPQLLNVLKGEMSLVGPRPHAVAQDQHYLQEIANYQLRQLVKPGITGWA